MTWYDVLGVRRDASAGDPERRAADDEELEGSPFAADEEQWTHGGFQGRTRFPWWIAILAVLLVIFVFTAYAGGPSPVPTPK